MYDTIDGQVGIARSKDSKIIKWWDYNKTIIKHRREYTDWYYACPDPSTSCPELSNSSASAVLRRRTLTGFLVSSPDPSSSWPDPAIRSSSRRFRTFSFVSSPEASWKLIVRVVYMDFTFNSTSRVTRSPEPSTFSCPDPTTSDSSDDAVAPRGIRFKWGNRLSSSNSRSNEKALTTESRVTRRAMTNSVRIVLYWTFEGWNYVRGSIMSWHEIGKTMFEHD